jgi:SAM-dependent methyltransferase/uncharacterized protein YbaR (Trm112 family)
MITRNLIQQLHCPYCGSELELDCKLCGDHDEIDNTILTCRCQSYPVIDGIVVLRPVSRTLLEHVRSGDSRLALRCALYELLPENSRRQRRRFIDALLQLPWSPARQIADRAITAVTSRAGVEPDETFYQASARLFSGTYADYLFHRYANPSFLAAVILLVTLDGYCPGVYPPTSEGVERDLHLKDFHLKNSTASDGQVVAAHSTPQNYWLLDLACGVGHSSFVIQRLLPHTNVLATDHNFVNLYFSRRFLASKAVHICFDAECPLPFADNFFSAVFCLDAFHYMLSKVALARELERTVSSRGLWLFPHLHNRQAPNAAPGVPLPLEGYQRCFEAIQPRFFAEAALLQSFFEDSSIDLGAKPGEAELRRTNAFCLIGGQQDTLWRRYQNVGSFINRDPTTLVLNPLYQPAPMGQRIQMQMRWPNRWLEAECADLKRYLPQQYELDRALWERLASHSPAPEDEATIQALARQFLLVHLPPKYRS